MPEEKKRRYPSPLRHRDFCVFWTGSLLANVGHQFTTVAMAWQIYELTNSPLQIGLLGLARGIPQIGLMLVGGLLADAVNRRKLMMVTQVSLFAVSTMLAVLTWTGKVTPFLLYVATFLLGLFHSLETPARQSIIPNLVPREELAQALALQGVQRYVPLTAGPSIAGVVLAVWGVTACYTIDAFSWLVMVGALALLRTKLQEGKGLRSISLRSLREGLGFVWGHGMIFPLMLLDFGATFFGNVRGLLPIYARDILLVGPQGLGLLYSARAVGALVAVGVLSIFGPVRRGGFWILIGVFMYGFGTVLFSGCNIFWLSVLLLGVVGAGDTISAILRSTINQLSTPDELRGRMSSVNSVFTTSGPHLGQFQSGVVAAWIGAELSALTGGLATLLIVAAVALGFRHVRRYQIAEVEVAAKP